MINLDQEISQMFQQADAHPALGWKHCRRVYYLAKELAGTQIYLDDEVIHIAALLHDMGKYPAFLMPNVDHALRSKGIASGLLKKYQYPQEQTVKILEAIETHMYYSEPGFTQEAIYLRDANTLDHLGNIGVMKLFSQLGQDPLLETSEDVIHLAQTFADALPKKVATKPARRIAVKRREEILRFLNGLRKQTDEYTWL